MKAQDKPKQSTHKGSGPQHGSDQRDAGLAAETRPVPSQAEGDEETVEQDLNRVGKKQ